MTGRRPEPPSFFYGWLPRLVSFLLAVTVILLVMAVPELFFRGDGVQVLPLLAILWGLAAGFMHGLGFAPGRPLPRLLLGPGPAWLFLIGGLLWILVRGGVAPGGPA